MENQSLTEETNNSGHRDNLHRILGKTDKAWGLKCTRVHFSARTKAHSKRGRWVKGKWETCHLCNFVINKSKANDK